MIIQWLFRACPQLKRLHLNGLKMAKFCASCVKLFVNIANASYFGIVIFDGANCFRSVKKKCLDFEKSGYVKKYFIGYI